MFLIIIDVIGQHMTGKEEENVSKYISSAIFWHKTPDTYLKYLKDLVGVSHSLPEVIISFYTEV